MAADDTLDLRATSFPRRTGRPKKAGPFRQAHQILPAARQRRCPRADRRRLSGVQRRAPLGGLPHLRRQDAGARQRHDDRPDARRRAHARRARRLPDRADGARAHRLHDQHGREPLSRPALRPELHAPPRLALPRRSRPVRRGHHPHLRRAVPGVGAPRDRPVRARLPRALRPRRPDRHLRAALPSRPGSAVALARLRGVLRGGRCREIRRADLHLVARRQLHRHERRVSRADERVAADDRSQSRRQRGLRDRPRREEERLRDPRRRIAEELLPAGAAHALGGLRDPEGRQRLLHSDHDRSGGLGRPVRSDAGRGRQLGQGEPWRAAGHGRGLRRLDDCVPAVLRVRRGLAEQPAHAQGARAQARRSGVVAQDAGQGRRQPRARTSRSSRPSATSTATAEGPWER